MSGTPHPLYNGVTGGHSKAKGEDGRQYFRATTTVPGKGRAKLLTLSTLYSFDVEAAYAVDCVHSVGAAVLEQAGFELGYRGGRPRPPNFASCDKAVTELAKQLTHASPAAAYEQAERKLHVIKIKVEDHASERAQKLSKERQQLDDAARAGQGPCPGAQQEQQRQKERQQQQQPILAQQQQPMLAQQQQRQQEGEQRTEHAAGQHQQAASSTVAAEQLDGASAWPRAQVGQDGRSPGSTGHPAHAPPFQAQPSDGRTTRAPNIPLQRPTFQCFTLEQQLSATSSLTLPPSTLQQHAHTLPPSSPSRPPVIVKQECAACGEDTGPSGNDHATVLHGTIPHTTTGKAPQGTANWSSQHEAVACPKTHAARSLMPKAEQSDAIALGTDAVVQRTQVQPTCLPSTAGWATGMQMPDVPMGGMGVPVEAAIEDPAHHDDAPDVAMEDVQNEKQMGVRGRMAGAPVGFTVASIQHSQLMPSRSASMERSNLLPFHSQAPHCAACEPGQDNRLATGIAAAVVVELGMQLLGEQRGVSPATVEKIERKMHKEFDQMWPPKGLVHRVTDGLEEVLRQLHKPVQIKLKERVCPCPQLLNLLYVPGKVLESLWVQTCFWARALTAKVLGIHHHHPHDQQSTPFKACPEASLQLADGCLVLVQFVEGVRLRRVAAMVPQDGVDVVINWMGLHQPLPPPAVLLEGSGAVCLEQLLDMNLTSLSVNGIQDLLLEYLEHMEGNITRGEVLFTLDKLRLFTSIAPQVQRILSVKDERVSLHQPVDRSPSAIAAYSQIAKVFYTWHPSPQLEEDVKALPGIDLLSQLQHHTSVQRACPEASNMGQKKRPQLHIGGQQPGRQEDGPRAQQQGHDGKRQRLDCAATSRAEEERRHAGPPPWSLGWGRGAGRGAGAGRQRDRWPAQHGKGARGGWKRG